MFLVLCLTALALLGWGRLTLKLIGFKLCSRPDCFTIWLGFGIVLGLIDFLHLFFPVDWRMTASIGMLGLFGCRVSPDLNYRLMIDSVRIQLSKNWIFSFIGSVTLVFWCLRAMGTPNNFDSGLYHFETIRWLNEFPLVPGLGNLHWRFAFNQSHFNFLALLNCAPYWGKGYATGGLFLLLLSLVTLVEFGLKQSKTWFWIFGGALFVYFGYTASGVSNPAPDGVVGLVQVTAFLLLFRVLDVIEKSLKEDAEQRLRDIATLLILCITMITIKLSGALFAIGCFVIVLWKNYQLFKVYVSKWMLLGAILFLLVIVHLSRGYLLSGFPLFPGLMLGMTDLPWSLSAELVKFESDLIKSWARLPGILSPEQVLANWAWVQVWLKTISLWWAILLSATLFLTAVAIGLLLVDKIRQKAADIYLLYLPLIATLIFWFVTAPDPRFLGSILVLCIALSVWLLTIYIQFISGFCSVQWPSSQVFTGLGALFISLIALKLTGLNSISVAGWQAIPIQAVEVKKTESGLAVYVPKDGVQCWNETLPCASIFNANLSKQTNIFLALNRIGLMNDFYFTTKLSVPK